MRTWDDYKEYIRNTDENGAAEITEIESLSQIISSMIAKRHALGISQDKLAEMCGMSPSSVANIESHSTVPKLDVVLKIFQTLGLRLNVTPV